MDGGVTRNLPVDVVRDMGADIVIAVDLGADLSSREIESLVNIYQQLGRMQIRTNVEPQLELADFVLRPAVTQYGTLQFGQMQAIIDLGYQVAVANAAQLEGFSLPPGEYNRPALAERINEPQQVLSEVRFEGNQRVDDRVIHRRIRLEAGSPLVLKEIGAELGRVFGLGDFESVTFDLESHSEGPELLLHLQEKAWGAELPALRLPSEHGLLGRHAGWTTDEPDGDATQRTRW